MLVAEDTPLKTLKMLVMLPSAFEIVSNPVQRVHASVERSLPNSKLSRIGVMVSAYTAICGAVIDARAPTVEVASCV